MPKKEKEELKNLGQGEHGEILAQWSFPEVSRYQRGTGWWIIMGLIGLGLIIWSLSQGNFLFAMIIVLVALIVIFYSKREPIEVNFQITQDGLLVGSSFYEWSKIKKFWIIYQPPEVKRLYFQLKGSFPPFLSIPLERQNPVKIRRILLKYALEDLSKEEESFGDFLSRTLKI